MTAHNRIWLLLIILGWAAFFAVAALTDGFTHAWVPHWEHPQAERQ
ncbi:MAG: hypothetical protein HOP95_08905 [Sphingomonas sp.]|nr:hypothetical protein [Sphingomonas sp.]